MASKAESDRPLPEPGQIWFIEHPRLGKSTHGHYALVTQVLPKEQLVNINFISSDSNFHGDLLITRSIDGFDTSGLKHDSYLLRDRSFDISITLLLRGKYKGFISRVLKKGIEDWWGAPL